MKPIVQIGSRLAAPLLSVHFSLVAVRQSCLTWGYLTGLFLLVSSTAFGQCFQRREVFYGLHNGPRAIAVGDVNNDGRPDLITADYFNHQVTVLWNYNSTSGRFQIANSYGTGNGPISVAAGDVNGDGFIDLVTANAESNTVTLLRGNSSASFDRYETANRTDYSVGIAPYSVAISDVNRDGRLDLITANITSNNVTVLRGKAGGGFDRADYAAADGPGSVAVGDVNNDGRPDMITGNFSNNTLTVLRGNASSGFDLITYPIAEYANFVKVGDVNGDGRLDLILVNISINSVTVLRGNTAGGFDSTTYGVDTYPTSVAVGDVTGDGRVDLITTNVLLNTVTVLRGNDNGGFDRTDHGVGGGPNSVVVADIDGNQRLDLITANYGENSVTVLFNQLPPTFIATDPAAICSGQSINLATTVSGQTLAGGTLSYYATLTDAQTARNRLPSSTVSPTNTTTYFIRYQLSGSGNCYAVEDVRVTVNPRPAPPSLLTQSGQAYPGGQPSVTVSQNSGTVNLVIGGCNGGTLIWTGSGNTAGSSTPIAVPTSAVGTVVYQATCQLNGYSCISAPASATVIVQGGLPTTTLSVLHQNADYNQPNNNTIKPSLQLQNEGSSAIPYGEITLRYWLTVEQFAPLTNLVASYAQLGTDKVKMKYVPADQPRQGAFGYIEYSFDSSAGNLAGNSNSGPIQSQNGIRKEDWTVVNENDDYSYANSSSYIRNNRITAYRNGTLIWGAEPAVLTPVQNLKVYTENKSSTTANSISTYLQLRNEGNVAVAYEAITVRYYFTADTDQPLNAQVSYAVLASNNVKAKFVSITPPLANADTYIELSFSNLGQFYPLSSTGNIQYRITKQDWSNFNQSNDYSYQNGSNPLAENNRVVVYVRGQRVYGTEPGAGARIASKNIDRSLKVLVLGNPVQGSEVGVEVQGAEGQPLRLQVVDSQGRVISQMAVGQARAVERTRLELSPFPGVYFLQVSTPVEQQVVKVVNP